MHQQVPQADNERQGVQACKFRVLEKMSTVNEFQKKRPVWGTKGFTFWTFLSLALMESRPKSILELGSGRSTITLAEYCKLNNSLFISIETVEFWHWKGQLELTAIGLPINQIKLVPLSKISNWYDNRLFDAATESRTNFDCIFIDAPNELSGDSKGLRDSSVGIEKLNLIAGNADLIIIDDTHRKHVFASVDKIIINPDQFNKYFYFYSVQPRYQNSVCICARKGTRSARGVEKINITMRLNLNDRFELDSCPED